MYILFWLRQSDIRVVVFAENVGPLANHAKYNNS